MFPRVSIILSVLLVILTVSSTCVTEVQSSTTSDAPNDGDVVSGHYLSLEEIQGMIDTFGVRGSETMVGGDQSTGVAPPTLDSWLSRVGEFVVDSVESPGAVPSRVDLSIGPYFPPIGDQGMQNSCSAWAVAYYSYGYLEAKDRGWDDAYTGNPSHTISPAWSYNRVNGGCDQGSWPEDVGRVIRDWGVPTMAEMPYSQSDIVSWGDSDAFRDAPLHRASEVHSMVHDNDTVEDVKALLSSGTPVNFLIYSGGLGTYVGGDFTVTADEVDANKYTDHCQTIVGYDDSHTAGGDTGAFKVANSWGTSWGDSGFYWVTYDAFDRIASIHSYNTGLTYMVDEVDYDPSLLALWEFDGPPTRDGTLSVSIGPSSTPTESKSLFFESSYVSDIRFPNFMCLDVTEFQVAYDGGATTFNLMVSGNSLEGTIASFKVEAYGGYSVGSPEMVSGQSTGVRMNTPGTVSVTMMPYTNPGVSAALDCPHMTFSHGTGPEWVPVFAEHSRGNASLQSGIIPAGGMTSFTTTVTGPGILSYGMRLSCQGGHSDLMTTSIDGDPTGTFSGVIPWTKYEVNVSAGTHLVTWEYCKDPSGTFGSDCAWVDDVQFRRASAPLTIHGDDTLAVEALLNGWSGSGTSGDPYIIRSLDIDAHGSLAALNMMDISSYIRIEHCRFHNATGPGIELIDVGNVTLVGDTVEDCGSSYLFESTDPSMEGNVFMDVGGPGIIIVESGNVTNSALFSWSASTAHDPGQVSYLVSVDSQPWVDVGTTTSMTFQMVDGTHIVEVRGTDSNGNEYTKSHSFILDTIDPTLDIMSPMEGDLFNVTEVKIDWVDEGTGASIVLREYRIDGGDWVAVEGTLLILQLGDGNHTIDVRVWDEGGNSNISSVDIAIDTTPPIISIMALGSPTDDPAPIVSWDASDQVSGVAGHLVQVDYGAPIDVGMNGSLKLDLADGGHWITITAYDMAMNSDNMTIGIMVDTIAPAVWGLDPFDGDTVDDCVFDLTFHAMDNGTGIDEASVSVDHGQWVVATHGGSGWDLTLTADMGVHELTVRVTDTVGNVNETHLTIEVVDVTAPTVVDAGPMGLGASLDPAIVITFSEPMDHDSVTIHVMSGLDAIQGTVSWVNDTMTFMTDQFPMGATIEVTVTGDDAACNAMAPYTWSFTTQESTSLIVDVRDGSGPVSGAEVSVDGILRSTTDSEGRCTVLGLDPGEHTVNVLHDGMNESRTVSLENGSVVTLDMSMGVNEDTSLWTPVILAIVAMSVLVAALVLLSRSKED